MRPTSMSEYSVLVYCVAMVVLSLLCFKREIEQDEIRKPLLIKLETEWIEWFSTSLLIPSILE